MKFKQSKHPNHLIFDDGASKTEFKLGTKYIEDLAKYLADGNQIEPYETPEEEAARLIEEKKKAIVKQETDLLDLIKKYDYHLTSERKIMKASKDIWKAKIAVWDDQIDLVRAEIAKMKAGQSFNLIEISPVPVFE